ncbi:MAG: 3-deoxy-8-phosphooctulonate synthase [Phycisphaerales bacterium]
MIRECIIGSGDRGVVAGSGRGLVVIGGPCALESYELAMRVGEAMRDACASHGLGYVFKSSFDKANRTSMGSGRGPGMEEGLRTLERVRVGLGVAVTTDLHAPEQAGAVAEVVDLLQIPAFLCRQTDLLVAAGRAAAERGRAVNVKKGQFVSPAEMAGPVGKLRSVGCGQVMLTERGTFFGYHRLVNDFVGLGDLMELGGGEGSEARGAAVCFDVTHSTQLPGASAVTGGRPERAPMLARAAVAAGVDAVFIECHPEPARALSDAATQLPVEVAVGLVGELARIRGVLGD